MKRYADIFLPIIYIASLIVSVIATAAYVLISNIDVNNLSDAEFITVNTISNGGFYLFATVVMILLFLSVWKDQVQDFWARKKDLLVYVVIGVIGMFVALTLIGNIMIWLGYTETPENQQIIDNQLNGSAFDIATLVIFTVLLAPIVEELVFRYAGFGILKRIFKRPIPWLQIVLSALIFGSIHLTIGEYMPLMYYSGLGLVLGFMYYKSENIIPPILVHLLFNGFVVVTMFVGL